MIIAGLVLLLLGSIFMALSENLSQDVKVATPTLANVNSPGDVEILTGDAVPATPTVEPISTEEGETVISQSNLAAINNDITLDAVSPNRAAVLPTPTDTPLRIRAEYIFTQIGKDDYRVSGVKAQIFFEERLLLEGESNEDGVLDTGWVTVYAEDPQEVIENEWTTRIHLLSWPNNICETWRVDANQYGQDPGHFRFFVYMFPCEIAP